MWSVSAIWLPLVSVLPQLFLYQPCLVAGQEQFNANFFRFPEKLLLPTSMTFLFPF